MIVSVIAFILICLDIHGLASLVLLCIFIWYIDIHLVYLHYYLKERSFMERRPSLVIL